MIVKNCNIKVNKTLHTSSGGAAGTRIVGTDPFFRSSFLAKPALN